MKRTEKLNLPQFEASDPFQRADFNDAFSALEAGCSTAMEDAAEAKEIAKSGYTPDNKPYAVGSYVGTGTAMSITVGFRPSFVSITGTQVGTSSSSSLILGYHGSTGGNTITELVAFTDTGFDLLDAGSNHYPALFVSGRTYDYIAFR